MAGTKNVSRDHARRGDCQVKISKLLDASDHITAQINCSENLSLSGSLAVEIHRSDDTLHVK